MFTVETELAWMLRALGRDRERRPGLKIPGLQASFDELRAWTDDPRPYEKRYHQKPWRTVTGDVSVVVDTVGSALRLQAPSLERVATLAGEPEPGASPQWRADCRAALASAAAELTDPAASVAALDDLYAALQDPTTPYDVVEALTFHLEVTLRFGGRTLASEGHTLGGVLSNDAGSVAIARSVVRGEKPLLRRPAEASTLTVAERIALCRDYLMRSTPRGNQVVWVAFENGHVRRPDWILPIGGVTFYDGSTLASVLDDLTDSLRIPQVRDRLPAELLADDAVVRRELDIREYNEGLTEWVWARVELGDEPFVSPVAQAHRIAESLVDLAAFYGGGTHWRPMEGGVLVVDGEALLGGPIYRQVDLSEHERHWTSETLAELADDLAPHVPAIAGPLLDLLTTARTVQANGGDDANTAALLIDVQVIELISSMTRSAHWSEHMRSNLAPTWARQVVLDELIDAYREPTGNPDLSEVPEVAAIRDHYEPVSGDHTNRVHLRYDLALHRLQATCDALPTHAPGARRLRTLNSRLHSPAAAGQWIDDLVHQYGEGVDRLARCRDAAAHGGPTNRAVVASVRRFANTQAARLTSIAIQAMVSGLDIRHAHDQPRSRDVQWRAAIDVPGATTDALLDTPA